VLGLGELVLSFVQYIFNLGIQIIKDLLDQFLIENNNNLDSKNFNFEIFNVVKQLKNNRNGMIQKKVLL
jgi:hypothetical protein